MLKIFPILLLLSACEKTPPPSPPDPPITDRFEKIPEAFSVSRPIPEASGMADSRTIADHLWVQEDSGNPPQLFLLKHQGVVSDSFMLAGATNRDWEDIAVGKGPDDALSYIYIGDIGDNSLQYPTYTIYRVPEPSSLGEDNITVYDKIEFSYPDGSHDAEALLVDDATKDLYVITKRDAKGRIYKITYPQQVGSVNAAVFVGELTYTGVVSSALSASATELIVKTYTNLFYYSRTAGEGLGVTLAKNPTDTLDYQLEAQGEAVAFDNKNSGFFTYSEKGLSDANPNLMFYARKR